jgi:hypothetical protein
MAVARARTTESRRIPRCYMAALRIATPAVATGAMSEKRLALIGSGRPQIQNRFVMEGNHLTAISDRPPIITVEYLP